MIVYRALSEQDEKQYQNGEDLLCTCSISNPSFYENNYESINGFNNIKNSLDTVISHVDGEDLINGRSPWISTSKDVKTTMIEYAIPKNNHFNTRDVRRPIAVICIDKVYDDSEELSNLLLELYKKNNSKRGNDVSQFAIDISSTKLSEYYNKKFSEGSNYVKRNNHIIDVKDSNENIGSGECIYFRHDSEKEVPIYNMEINSLDEVLVYSKIPHKSITFVMTPLVQDILYATGKSVEDIINNLDEIEKIVIEVYNQFPIDLKNLFNYLYCPDGDIHNAMHYSGSCYSANLIDLVSNYKDNIVDNYSKLKMAKREMFRKMYKALGSCLSYPKLVDDRMYVGIPDDEMDVTIYSKANAMLLIDEGGKIIRTKAKYSLRDVRDMRIRFK